MNAPCLDQERTGAALDVEKFRCDLMAGLSRRAKRLPCKYLYDQAGARLFEQICDLEEYYLARTELAILRRHAREIASALGPDCRVVELGSGNGIKIRLLLNQLPRPTTYVPVDVAQVQLEESSADIAHDYPGLNVCPLCADYTDHFQFPDTGADSRRTVTVFLGSTLGNFEPEEAGEFLERIARLCGAGGGILLGIDLKKPAETLHRAYNDAQGITAAFNLNLLTRANRELEADFDSSRFTHQAAYNARAGRIEMRLVSRCSQRVFVNSNHFDFRDGESILTEHSYKYSLRQIRGLALRAGLELNGCWTDEKRWFSVLYLVPGCSP